MNTRDDQCGWLTTSQALALVEEIVGEVSDCTLRRWADAGKIDVRRTPGGQRRYSSTSIRALAGEERVA